MTPVIRSVPAACAAVDARRPAVRMRHHGGRHRRPGPRGTVPTSVNVPHARGVRSGPCAADRGRDQRHHGADRYPGQAASSEEMSDNSDTVSDLDCLGAIYGAEETVYKGSDWTAVRDQVAPGARRPTTTTGSSRSRCCIPSADKAQRFVEQSRSTWRKCARLVARQWTTTRSHSTWEIGDADVAGDGRSRRRRAAATPTAGAVSTRWPAASNLSSRRGRAATQLTRRGRRRWPPTCVNERRDQVQ